MRAPNQQEDATWYRLEGLVAYPGARVAPIRIESLEAHGPGEPSAIARWGEALMSAFQACVDRAGEEDADENGEEEPGR